MAKPTPPANADKRTDRAAIEFALYFVDVLNYTARSGDTDELERISTNDCESCQNIIEATEQVYSSGGLIRGGDWSIITQSVFQPNDEANERIVTFRVGTSAQTYRPSADATDRYFDAEQNAVDIYLRSTADSWRVTQMDKGS